MEQINKLNYTIENNTDIDSKTIQINEMTILIESEKKKLTKLLETITSDMIEEYTIPLKYEKYTLEELEEEFNIMTNVIDKINIYNIIKMRINKMEQNINYEQV
jgi:DNA-directed RNA polymerase sigma subunit (sigma70/sigma32)